jgi:hypothetical protein
MHSTSFYFIDMLSVTANPFAPQVQQPTYMSAFPVDYGNIVNTPCQSAIMPTSLLAVSDTVQRRSSRPSTLLSSDSLLAVRLQQEELWKPTKVKHNKLTSNYSVFAAHAAQDSAHRLSESQASGSAHKLSSHSSVLQVGTVTISLTKKRLHQDGKILRKASYAKRSAKPVAKRLKSGDRRPKFASVGPLLLQPHPRSRKARKTIDGCWPCSMPIRDTSFRENSRFFYADVFKDEARALRVNGFPIHNGMLR